MKKITPTTPQAKPADNDVVDDRCQFQHEGSRCPLKALMWEAGRNGEIIGPRLCVGHFTLRKDVGGSRVFLVMAIEGRHPFVPSWSDALVARGMMTMGNRKHIAETYGPRMIPWLEANAEHGKQGGKWERDYPAAVRAAVKAEQRHGAPA